MPVRALAINPAGALNIRVASAYFRVENAVGVSNWLTMLPTIWPSASLWARAAIQSGSVWNAVHFFSRSASDSQASS